MLGGLCFWLFQTDAKNFSIEKLVVLGKYQNFFLQIEKKFLDRNLLGRVS